MNKITEIRKEGPLVICKFKFSTPPLEYKGIVGNKETTAPSPEKYESGSAPVYQKEIF